MRAIIALTQGKLMRRAIVIRSSLVVCAVWLSAAPALQAQTPPPAETLAVAELRSLTLTRRDREAEARQWEAERPQREAEMAAARERAADPNAPEEDEAIVVSNNCGEATATFRILRATAPLPREFRIALGIGEFCEPPIGFEETAWLLVFDSNSGELRERYPAFVWPTDGSLYAISEFGPGANHSPEVRRLLTPSPLPEPLEYTVFREGDALHRYVERRQSLELRGGKVWLVSGIPLARIFPGFDLDDLLH
jgi:hypothetical protein